jgi:hypothetical protein
VARQGQYLVIEMDVCFELAAVLRGTIGTDCESA